jgi:6-phosphogluconolactonase
MTTSVIPGSLVTTKDEEGIAVEAATRIGNVLRDAIKQRGTVSFALSGGNTPRPAYERLAKEPGIDWTKVSIFWIDDRAVPPTHERSNYRLAKESLLDRAKIPAENVHRMIGEASDLDKAARDYEAVLRKYVQPASGREAAGVPSFDVAVMGIGDDGHTASLFPGDTAVDVRDRLVLAIAAAPGKEREARLTVSVPVIEEIGTIFVLVAGDSKRAPLERLWSVAGSTEETPSRILRTTNANLVWILDKAAAGVT